MTKKNVDLGQDGQMELASENYYQKVAKAYYGSVCLVLQLRFSAPLHYKTVFRDFCF